jgi:hypothetical protein
MPKGGVVSWIIARGAGSTSKFKVESHIFIIFTCLRW